MATNPDVLERIRLLSAAIVGGLMIGDFKHLAMRPMNPVLGETCQRVADDGTRFYAEQISHHPPITFIRMEASDDAWYFYYTVEYKAGISGMRHLLAERLGTLHLHFKDGSYYTFSGGNL